MIKRLFSRMQKPIEATPSYAARYLEHNIPSEAAAGSRRVFRVLVENSGDASWYRDPPDNHYAGLTLFVENEPVCIGRLIPEVVASGQKTLIALPVKLPEEPGEYALKLDMMINDVAWFESVGVKPLLLTLTLYEREKNRTEKMLEIAYRRNCWSFSPGQGIHLRGDDPTYPVFAESAKGCRITDVEGRGYIDLHMAGGSCLLGYSDERIQSAISRSMAGSGITSIQHSLEMEVAETLCGLFPSASEILFSKTGSDATNLAVRVARAYTGKRTILYSGYAGWHDWCVAEQGFGATGVPSEYGSSVYHLRYRDLEALEKSAAEHADDLAAIMIEPAATTADLSDPHHDTDVSYLRIAEKLARDNDALFILDEIVTGFRFRTGSAQKAFNLSPDLTCLGKALSNGMPLAALVGKGTCLGQTAHRIAYSPTYKSDIFSLAAALESLRIYEDEDIPSIIWNFGEALRQRVDKTCEELDLNSRLVGPPYRMFFGFLGIDERELEVLSRTLLQQELARNGVITCRGYVLPSSKHDNEALEACAAAFENALGVIRKAWNAGSMARYLDIPDVW